MSMSMWGKNKSYYNKKQSPFFYNYHNAMMKGKKYYEMNRRFLPPKWKMGLVKTPPKMEIHVPAL